jgi:pimeloyl-ACP methyl ester carboxylesterase
MPQDDPATLTVPDLSTSDQRVLARIFQHPLSHNLSWREALGLMATLGSVSHAHDGDVVLRIGHAESRFFDDIATALSGEGRIVVIGHGMGQSNEAGHLMAYLTKHHPTVHARVADHIVADLAHSTVPQLLSLARQALQAGRDSAEPSKG